ncbi:helix-turn-helix transcriptional regulator [Novispirillum itersonii]|uniref:AraC family transcriptional activator of pyochelin receptor n=1 Tax=Novispirillum itersonii TaxID=189 RepID=A0A7W9ZEY7_NOVIT|nr:AraC family transcriptional regulator [Novispirillum itersonii]MBB6209024.1 AraC family transcriptional activator of pyochelin receptor [Novispirillum itersonii]
MECVEAAGVRLFLDTQTLRSGDRWLSRTAPGLWLGVLVDGSITTRHDTAPPHHWTGNMATGFWAEQPLETEHLARVDSVLSGVFVHMDSETAGQLLGDAAVAPLLRREPVAHPSSVRARRLSRAMLACSLSGAARRLALMAQTFELVAALLPEASPSEDGQGGPTFPARDRRRAQDARDILLATMAAPPTLPEVARQVGLNVRRLGQVFAGEYGLSPGAWVKEQRLLQAREALERGEGGVATVAYRFGYTPAHFSAEFRRRFGMPPSAFLKDRDA